VKYCHHLLTQPQPFLFTLFSSRISPSLITLHLDSFSPLCSSLCTFHPPIFCKSLCSPCASFYIPATLLHSQQVTIDDGPPQLVEARVLNLTSVTSDLKFDLLVTFSEPVRWRGAAAAAAAPSSSSGSGGSGSLAALSLLNAQLLEVAVENQTVSGLQAAGGVAVVAAAQFVLKLAGLEPGLPAQVLIPGSSYIDLGGTPGQTDVTVEVSGG
jgi:hypothetical protein